MDQGRPADTLIPRESRRWKALYRRRGAVERGFGRLKNEWGLLPLRVRGLDRVRLHTDLTILGQLAVALPRLGWSRSRHSWYNQRVVAPDDDPPKSDAPTVEELREQLEACHAKIADLELALGSRDVIGQAKGILMVDRGISADEAFDILVRASQRTNVKLRHIAAWLVARRNP